MIVEKEKKFFPYLYLLSFVIYLYSINDMDTSTNAYQAQGNRAMVYIYLVTILLLLGIYVLVMGRFYLIKPMGIMSVISLWLVVDNLIIGNFINGSIWTCATHIGLSVWWILALNYGYMIGEKNKNQEKQMMFFLLLMLLYYIIQFIDVAIVSNQTHEETTVLNLIYRIVVFVPIIWMLEKKWLRNLLLFAIFLMSVVSMKRGALIILPVMLIVALWGNGKKNVIKLSTILKGFAVCGVVIISIVIADVISDGFFSYRFSIEQLLYGSSRSEKYANAIGEILGRDIKDFFFGCGSIAKPGVHNEFLEFFYSFGFIGVILYLAFLYTMLMRMLQLRKKQSEYADVYGMIFAFVFVVGIYSGVYFVHSTFYIMLTLGMVERRIMEEQACEKQLA